METLTRAKAIGRIHTWQEYCRDYARRNTDWLPSVIWRRYEATQYDIALTQLALGKDTEAIATLNNLVSEYEKTDIFVPDTKRYFFENISEVCKALLLPRYDKEEIDTLARELSDLDTAGGTL